jgi:hypothetical protein
MPSLQSITDHESTTTPGVRFRVRVLNVVRRARRDAAIADQRLEYTRATTERAAAFRLLVGEDGTIQELNDKANLLPDEKRVQLYALDERCNGILQQHIIPATIRAGLVEITGLQLNGKPADAELLIEEGPDDLLAEVYEACANAAGLTEEQAKN